MIYFFYEKILLLNIFTSSFIIKPLKRFQDIKKKIVVIINLLKLYHRKFNSSDITLYYICRGWDSNFKLSTYSSFKSEFLVTKLFDKEKYKNYMSRLHNYSHI